MPTANGVSFYLEPCNTSRLCGHLLLMDNSLQDPIKSGSMEDGLLDPESQVFDSANSHIVLQRLCTISLEHDCRLQTHKETMNVLHTSR